MDSRVDGKRGAGVPATAFRVAAWVGVAAVAFAAGRFSTSLESQTAAMEPGFGGDVLLIQNTDQRNDPRELIPLPRPDQQGEQPGSQQQPQQGECPQYFFEDGQLFQLPPGPPGQGPGRFGDSPELFPLEPAPGAPSRPRPAPRPQPQAPPPFNRPPSRVELPLSTPVSSVVWQPGAVPWEAW